MRAPRIKMRCPLLFKICQWITVSVLVVCTSGNLNLDMFRNAMRDGFPDRDIDMNRLIHKYTEICPYLTQCDLDHVEEPGPIVYSRSEVSIPSCRPCSCSRLCMNLNKQNCCPGNAYQYWQYEEINLILYSGHYRTPDLAYMIGHCPSWYNGDQETINLCMGNASIVTGGHSYRTELVYKNAYCAACHNETNLEYPNLEVFCLEDDKDVSRNTDDILNRKGCWMNIYGGNRLIGSHTAVRVSGNNDAISSCNVTGLWGEFDEDVNWACKNTVNHYEGFKNVFCYICNPSISSTRSYTLVDKCNVTGKWKVYNRDIENTCLSKPQTQRLFPFKNIHCQICNGIENILDGNSFTTSIVQTIYPPQFNISLQFNKHDSEEFLEEIHRILDASGIHLNVPKPTGYIKEKLRNVSDIIDRFESVCGRRFSCRTPDEDVVESDANPKCFNKISVGTVRCVCSNDCAERLKCCPDLLLKSSPYSCVSPNYFQIWNGNGNSTTADMHLNPDTPTADIHLNSDILVIDECLTDDSVDNYLRFNFTNSPKDLGMDIPVRTSNNVMYKNLTYLLCNSATQTAYFDLRLLCKSYIEHILFPNFIDMLQNVKNHCSITFLSPNAIQCRKKSPDLFLYVYGRADFTPTRNISENTKNAIDAAYIWTGEADYNKCNKTMMWQEQDNDIKFVCENDGYIHLPTYELNGFEYRNFACFLCNPILRGNETDHVILSCNVTGAWTSTNIDMVKQCSVAKYHQRYLPFKNYFCSECNLPTEERIFGGPKTNNRYGTLLFTISEKQWQLHHNDPETKEVFCLNGKNQSLQEHCRDVKCSAYHHLENGSCTSLLLHTMAYVMSFKLNFRQNPCNQTTCSPPQCKHVQLDSLIQHIAGYIKYYVYSRSYKGYVDSLCDKKTNVFSPTASSTVFFTMTFIFYPYDYYSFDAFELLMLQFLDGEHALNITHDNKRKNRCTLVFQPEQKQFPKNARTKHSQRPDAGSCYFSGTDKLLYDTSDVLVIDRFLLCLQLEFSSDEYRYNSGTDSVTLTHDRMTFPSGYFKRQGNAIRICLEDYKARLNQTFVIVENSLIQVYNVFSNIVIGISLVSLALTFATYCMLPSLRTLPGKNIMLLTASLFCAQVLLLFALRLDSNTLLCQTMGILIHYSWLMAYCAMNICSFHLFHVFYLNTLTKATPSSDNKRFVGYVAYTLGVPFLVVAATICIYAIPSHGESVGYGEILCFLSDINASIAAFIAPSMLVFTSNIVFFSLAFHKIRTTAKVQTSGNTERSDLFICFRICTIVGITGPLYLLDSFIGFSYFSFVVEGINSLQGLLICVSYICNRRVLTLFRQRFTRDQ